MKGLLNMKKIKINKLIKYGLLLIIILGGAYYFFHKSQPTTEDTVVTTAPAIIGTVETYISSMGTLNPANQYEVKSLVKGNVLEAPFEEGDTVEKGSTLYQISTSEITNTIKTAELGLSKTKLAYDDYLAKKKDLKIKSTHSGYIKKLYFKEGDKVSSGVTIADLYNGDVLYLDLLFPEQSVKKNWVGKTSTIQMDSTEDTIKGKVTSVSSMIETMSGGILSKKVTICVKNTAGIGSNDIASATINGISSNNSGTFRAETATTIVATSEGIVENLYVEEGNWINAKDVVLKLTSKDLDNQIRDAKIAVSEANLSLKTQKAQMNLYTISSPISGTIITKTKKQDDTIDPANDTQSGPMAIIYDMSYLTFQMNIDELQIKSIKKGQKVTITSEALTGESFEGIIDRISLKGTTNNGITSYPVLVKVDSFGGLLPGMNVSGNIIIEHADNVLTVPSSALQRDNILYIQTKDSVKSDDPTIPDGFKAVTVEIGLNDGANVEIKSGLKEGDMVYIPFDTTVESSVSIYTE